jgi:Tfp pilus assembly protein PilV
MRMRARSRLEQAGFSLAEAVVTVAVSMMGLGGVMLMNAQQLKLVSSTRESNAASWALQDRLEQLRNVSWNHLTDADRLTAALSDLPDCAKLLPNYEERVTLVKSSDAGKEGASQLIIERNADGQTRTVSRGDLSKSVEVKVDVLVSWTGKGGRHRERSYTSIISDSGISRTNVQGFGGPTGAPPVENGGSDSTTSDPATSDDGSSATETQPVEIIQKSNGNDNGNGNGNGNGGNSSNGNPHGNTNQHSGKN